MNDTATTEARATALTALLQDAPKPDDHDGVRDYLHHLAALGCAPLLVYPGAKVPAETRSPRQRVADDRAAQQAAKAAGRRNWQKVTAPRGVYLASDDPAVLDGYLGQYAKAFGDSEAVNVAVSVGRSRLVVVDCDTADQLAAFLVDMGAAGDTAPTVRTPGACTAQGEWIHRDGGHFYFTVPEGVELPDGVDSWTDPAGGYCVAWGPGRYVLTPPSVRAEGPYVAIGNVHELPVALQERIAQRAPAARRVADRSAPSTEATLIDEWSRGVGWGEILLPSGWTPTGQVDACGCPTWTAPGEHASPKSATGHEAGCGEPRYDTDNPPLHIWTDSPGAPFADYTTERGSSTLSKLQAVALIDFDNDMGAAMEAHGLVSEPATLQARQQDTGVQDDAGDQRTGSRGLRITWASEIEPVPVPWLWVDISESTAARTTDPFRLSDSDDVACVPADQTWTPPEVETNGRIACGMVSIAAGREGSGKSSFGIWLTAKITRGTLPGAHYGRPRKVFYLATEDSWQHTLVPRLIAAGADMLKVGRIEVVRQEGATVTLSLPDDIELLTQAITEHGVALVVVDPLMSTLGAGLDANGSRDVRTALEPLAAMADRTRAAVVGIAHFNKSTGLDSLSRITGSGAFKDIARAVFVFADNGDERVFSQRKNSVGRYDLPSLTYAIRSEFVDTPTGRAPAGVFQFTGIADRTVDDVLDDERQRKRPKTPVQQFLIDYITEHADAETGEVDAAYVIAAGEKKQFSPKQITDARNRASNPEISTRKVGYGKDGRNLWKLGR